MKQISQIKHILANKLQIIESSLELRIKLNLQVIDSLTKFSGACTQVVSTSEDRSMSVRAQVDKSEDVINQCYQAIQKLRLLENALPYVECATALKLYQEYSELSLQEFKQILSVELKRHG